MKADLHCHSYYSDGTQSTAWLIERALLNEVTHLAITDHDCTDGLSDIPLDLTDIKLIKGVEISASWGAQEIHIVGLNINPEHSGLSKLLASQQQARKERVKLMAEKLEALGSPGLMAHLDALPCVAYTRSHVANFLVESGVCKTRQKSFKSHLGKGGKIYVPSQWCSLAEAVAGIRASGGMSILAHPGRYPINNKALEILVADFKAAGGDGLEGSYPNINPAMTLQLNSLAETYDLYMSAGSDFHDPAARWTDIGKFPWLDPENDRGIWRHPRW